MQSPYHPIKIFLAAVFIILLANTSVKAAEPVVHISPKPVWLSTFKPYDKRPSLRSIEGGYFFELIEHQVQVEKQANYHHFIREIVSDEGIQNGSEISISFDPTYERLDFHEITVWRDGKPQNRLKVSAFKVLADEKELANFIYEGTYSALCILEDIRKGDRIEYSYTITGRNPIFQNKFAGNLYFQWYQTVEHQYTSLVFSSQRKMNMKSFNEISKPVISEANGLKHYEWEDFQVKPALYDDSEPAWYDARAYVQLSDYADWKEVTDWALSINPTRTNIGGDLGKRIAKLKSESGDDKVKYFRNAVRTVQNEVRYMGIEIGQYSHRANDPQRVFNQRYGDCKDKSLLLVSMLQADGIDAHMALANTDMGSRIDQFIPSPDVFNHAVVVAEVNGKQVWVDATINDQGGTGSDIWFPDYGKGLALKTGNAALTNIPVSRTGKISLEEKFTVTEKSKPVLLEVKTTYTLNEADKIRDRLASNGMEQTEKDYLKYYAKAYNKIESKDSVRVVDDQDRNVLTTFEKYEVADFFKKDSASSAYRADFYADCIRQELPSVTSQTTTPVSVTYPYTEEYIVKVILPDGWDITNKQNSIKREGYEFSSDYSAVGDTLLLNYKFTYLKDHIPVAQLAQFKQDIKDMSDRGLAYGISYSAADNDTPQKSDFNQWMMNLGLLIVLMSVFLAFRIYRTETPAVVFSYGTSFVPLGGWLILMIIGLFIAPLYDIFNIVKGEYLSTALWAKYSSTKNSGLYHLYIVYEFSALTFLVCYSIFCLVLMLNRRDIFPKFMIGLYVFAIAFRVTQYLFSLALHSNVSAGFTWRSIINAIMAVIWIMYLKRSYRVEETFVTPYPSNNYSYEGPPEKRTEMVNQ